MSLKVGSKIIIGHVLIEGSSTAYGIGDETGRLGFTGEFMRHYSGLRPSDEPCKWVYVYPYAQLDNLLPHFTPYVRGHAEHAKSLVVDHEARLVGIFVVGGVMDSAVRRNGKDAVLAQWRTALKNLAATCDDQEIAPLFFRVPNIERTRRGDIPDSDLRNTLDDYTIEAANSIGAPYVTFEEIVGSDLPEHMAPDKIHPTAQGHRRIFEHLLPLVDERLGVVQ